MRRGRDWRERSGQDRGGRSADVCGRGGAALLGGSWRAHTECGTDDEGIDEVERRASQPAGYRICWWSSAVGLTWLYGLRPTSLSTTQRD